MEYSPHKVLEFGSLISGSKDTKVLHKAYWEAGVREYWLVDARRSEERRVGKGCSSRGSRENGKKEGWGRSAVLGKSVSLTRSLNARTEPEYAVAMRYARAA